MLKLEKIESDHLAFTSNSKRKRPKKIEASEKEPQKQQKDTSTNAKNKGFFFVEIIFFERSIATIITPGVLRKVCFLVLFVPTSEFNLVSIPRHTQWIDSSATTNISVSLQDCTSCRKPTGGEKYIYMGDGKTVEVEAIENLRLLLKIG